MHMHKNIFVFSEKNEYYKSDSVRNIEKEVIRAVSVFFI